MGKRKVALIMQDLLKGKKENGEFDFVYSGGDRYTLDLANLIKEMGMEPTIFQASRKQVILPNGEQKEVTGDFFDVSWEGYRVIGLPSNSSADLNRDAAQNTQEYDMAVYFHMLLSHPRAHRRSVSISHGIWFDHVNFVPQPDEKWNVFREHVLACIAATDKVVSVDTNTINFMAGMYSGRFRDKFVYIPNHTDTDLFKPVDRSKRDKVRILYPRRLDIIRGLTEMQRITEYLTSKYKHVEVEFCGHHHVDSIGSSMVSWAQAINSKVGREAVFLSRYPFREMPQAYNRADIAVIPTMGCEGTSYSALEALSSGLPTVVTTVGGLSELVIDGHNGLKVAPYYRELQDAVEYLVKRPEERKRMGENARLVGLAHGKQKWQNQWKDVIKDVLR